MADQASIVVEMLNRYYPELTQSGKNSPDMCIPAV
jgi:hypothetical protein